MAFDQDTCCNDLLPDHFLSSSHIAVSRAPIFQISAHEVPGLSQKQRQSMQQYLELVDWQGLKLPSAERRQQDSLKKIERSVEVWKDWIRLKEQLTTLGEELPPAELLPAKRKKQSPDPTKRDTSKDEFERRALAGGYRITLWPTGRVGALNDLVK